MTRGNTNPQRPSDSYGQPEAIAQGVKRRKVFNILPGLGWYILGGKNVLSAIGKSALLQREFKTTELHSSGLAIECPRTAQFTRQVEGGEANPFSFASLFPNRK